MANTLTLEFSNTINIDELLGTARPISPGTRTALEQQLGIDVEAFEQGRRTKKVQVSDLVAHFILGQLRIALNPVLSTAEVAEDNTQARPCDDDDELYLARAISHADEE